MMNTEKKPRRDYFGTFKKMCAAILHQDQPKKDFIIILNVKRITPLTVEVTGCISNLDGRNHEYDDLIYNINHKVNKSYALNTPLSQCKFSTLYGAAQHFYVAAMDQLPMQDFQGYMVMGIKNLYTFNAAYRERILDDDDGGTASFGNLPPDKYFKIF